MPTFRRNQAFKTLWQPGKIFMCICNTEHWYVHWYNSTFRKCNNFNWKITKFMQLFNFLNLIGIFAQCCIHNSLISTDYFIKWFVKKFIIEIIDKVCFDESLQSKHYHIVPSVYPAHSWSKI